MPQIANNVLVRRQGFTTPATLEIDGQEFPFHIAPELMVSTDGSPVSKLCIEILFDGEFKLEDGD